MDEATLHHYQSRLLELLAAGESPAVIIAALRDDPELAALYESLLASEARHHATYVDLARSLDLVPEAALRERLRELAEHEAEVIATAPLEPRLHNGPVG